MILAPTLTLSAGSGAAIVRPTFSRDFAGEKSLNNGTGPAINFTRGTNATFFDASGTLRFAPFNLLLHSEDFGNAAWNKELGATVTTNNVTAPDGSTTADTINFTATNANRVDQLLGTAANGETWTFSVWLKGSGTVRILADTSSGVGGATEVNITLTSTWTRYSATVTYSSPTGNRRAAIIWRTGNTATSVDAWGAQFVSGSQAGEYFRTTDAAASMPRFDHDPATGASRGLLIEESRTNSITRSVDFANAVWNKTSVTVTANTDIAPDGTTTASTITDSNTSAGEHMIDGGGSLTSLTDASVVTFSVFLKKTVGASNFAALRILFSGGTAFQRTIVVNTNTGAFTVTGSPDVGSVVNVGAYWRVALTASNGSGNTTAVGRIYPAWNSTGTTTGDGTTTGSVVAWGAQLEAGAFPTSYIPTTTAAATRSADSAVVTPISSFYNQSEGTLFAEHRVGSASGINGVFMADNGDVGTRVALFRSTIQVAISGVYTSIRTLSPSANTTAKVALAYSAQNHAGTIDGASVSTNSSIGVPSGINTLRIGVEAYGTSQLNGHIRKIAYYPKRLSNTLLQQLTT